MPRSSHYRKARVPGSNITLYLPLDIRDKLEKAAIEEIRSVGNMAVVILQTYLDERFKAKDDSNSH